MEKILTENRVRGLLEMAGLSSNLPEVKELHLENIGIDGIVPGALAKCDGLFKILAQKNKLKLLPKRLFHSKEEDKSEKKRGPRKLTFLDLSENLLQNDAIGRLSKWNIGNLVTLKLAGNSLTEFPGEVLKSLKNLHALVLNDNMLTTIKFETKMENLNTLILSSNKFEKLGVEVGFDKLPCLKKLSASKNVLTEFPALTPSSNPLLAEVRLSNNKIMSLSVQGLESFQFDQFTKLAVLDLSSNLIAFDKDLQALENCGSLIQVCFSNNPFHEKFKEEKMQYANHILNDIIKNAKRLKTLDSRPLSFFGLTNKRIAVTENSKKEEVKSKPETLLHQDKNTKKSDSSAEVSAEVDKKKKKKTELEENPEESQSEDSETLEPVTNKSKVKEEVGKTTLEDGDESDAEILSPDNGSKAFRDGSGVAEVVEVVATKKRAKKETDKDETKHRKKSKKASDSKGKEKAAWAVAKRIDTW